jgi:hypothetical protein
MYFIDKLALRAGNEKGDDEADTVGCCSLRCEHVTLEQPNYIIFDFLGKDSIRYYKRVPVDDQVFKNIKIFKQNKEDGDNLFDRVNVGRKCVSASWESHRAFVDDHVEQAFDVAHEGSHSQGLPYLQRFHHLPTATRREHAEEGFASRETQCVQQGESYGGHPV